VLGKLRHGSCEPSAVIASPEYQALTALHQWVRCRRSVRAVCVGPLRRTGFLDVTRLLCHILFQNQSPVAGTHLPSVVRWQADGSAFRLGGASGPSNGRDRCETPGRFGDAWPGERSWRCPREGSCSVPWAWAAPRGRSRCSSSSAERVLPAVRWAPQQGGNAGLHPNFLPWVTASPWVSVRAVLTLWRQKWPVPCCRVGQRFQRANVAVRWGSSSLLSLGAPRRAAP